MAGIIEVKESAVVFSERAAVDVYAAKMLSKALEIYAGTGMKVGNKWTPGVMIKRASAITGEAFKAREYLRASKALTTWADRQLKTAVKVVHANEEE